MFTSRIRVNQNEKKTVQFAANSLTISWAPGRSFQVVFTNWNLHEHRERHDHALRVIKSDNLVTTMSCSYAGLVRTRSGV